MILCHRAGMETLDTLDHVRIPPLPEVIALNEMTASANGVLTAAKVRGIALNPARLDEAAARGEEYDTVLIDPPAVSAASPASRSRRRSAAASATPVSMRPWAAW